MVLLRPHCPRLLLHSQICSYKLEGHVHHVMINVQTVNSNDYYSLSCISQPWCLSKLRRTQQLSRATSQEPDIFIDIFGLTTSRLNLATQRQWKPTRPCFYNCMLGSLWHTHWQRQITLYAGNVKAAIGVRVVELAHIKPRIGHLKRFKNMGKCL